jgi:hypothetical protein
MTKLYNESIEYQNTGIHNSEVYDMLYKIQILTEKFKELSSDEILTSNAIVNISRFESYTYKLLK